MSSGFITEAELNEQRRIRQEEWDKVRTADQPKERPEEPYDGRSLFEKLQEQKLKKDAEYEEAHKLKNMIKGLDDDEVEFLDLVDRQKLAEERRKNMEEEKELRDFKEKVANLQEKSMEERLKLELKAPQSTNKPNSSSNKNSQTKLLAGVVVKKPQKGEKEPQGTKRKAPETDESPPKTRNVESTGLPNQVSSVSSSLDEGALKCIGILPGLGPYEVSSDSASSSSDSEAPSPSSKKMPRIDMLGRLVMPKEDIEDGSSSKVAH